MGNIWGNDSDITVAGGGGNSGAAVNRSQAGVLVLMLGTNDSKWYVWNGTATYVKDMVEIATSLIKRAFVPQSNNTCQEGAKRRLLVILMTPPPVFKRFKPSFTGEDKQLKPQNESDFIRGRYVFYENYYLEQTIVYLANEIREGVREVAKRLNNTFGVSSTGYSQQNSSAKERCLSSSADVRVTVEVIDLFTL
eukprot:Tbor_TRINITY_DN5717_c1_g1::TRINITY_DN5717_c1_g1_i7::g.20560::m.20560